MPDSFHHQSSNTKHLDGLLGHLSSYSGLYSKNTFLQLYSGILRIIRQYRLKGVVFQDLHGDEDFETISLVLDNVDDVQLYNIDEMLLDTKASNTTATAFLEHTGFIIALTNQFCATLYWSIDSEDMFATLQGGWTFHPGDSKTAAQYLARHLPNSKQLETLIENTPLDRRYDEKQTWFITQLINNLESRNRELALALSHVSKLHDKMLDQERLAAVGQLCSVIAHEIRNPLGLIDLYAKLIETEVDKLPGNVETDKLAQHLKLIRESSQNLEGILSELTSYARPLTLETQEMSLCGVVKDVVDMYLPKYEEADVTLAFDPPGDDWMLDIDERRLKQALINLIKNALEVSTKDQTVRVVIEARLADDQVLVKIVDEGPGVDEKYQKKLFTPYFSTKGNGTGLGLAHSRKILQAHGGTVALLDSSAKGSTFALQLPLKPTRIPSKSPLGHTHEVSSLG
ncbi:MAG: HAMP domain-containing histidine kinase [Cyanobacteria bacterium HKST-UBA04]|nr:HAMP domain-containing histidine kinase [Cyanobacteria bacterium HKST-UBA04]